MRIALAQMFCAWGSVQANLASMDALCGQAGQQGAAMLLTPEMSVCGMYKDVRVWPLAESLDGPSATAVLQMARRHNLHIGFGFTERADGLPYNSYAVASPDGILAGVYRKNRVAPLEVEFWQSHNERPVFAIAGRRFAVGICLDNRCPELLADYGKQHADVVIMPHAWDADPLDRQGRELKYNSMVELAEHHRAGRLGGWKTHGQMRDFFMSYVPQRARENHFYALFVNQCGRPHPALRIVGPSFAVDPQGHVLVQTRDEREQVLCVDIV